jgi:hypothetical protein
MVTWRNTSGRLSLQNAREFRPSIAVIRSANSQVGSIIDPWHPIEEQLANLLIPYFAIAEGMIARCSLLFGLHITICMSTLLKKLHKSRLKY